LVLLELVLPDLDGLEVIRRIRERSQTPIIVLSARGDERDKIQALDKGADDYISKPFAVGEVLARVRVGLRHGAPAGQTHVTQVFAVGDLRIDLVRRHVTVRGATLHLSPIEYRLLVTLVRHAGNLVTQRQLLEEVWGPGYVGQPHYLRVYAGHLRRKLEADPARPRYLLTEPRVGYRLVVD
jgi:two-component system KDP operon response regulator KdpE